MTATQDLFEALINEDQEAVAAALAAGAALTEANDEGLLPLHVAAANHQLAMLEQLLLHGADPSVPDGDEKTTVEHALEGGVNLGSKLAALRVLVAGGARVDGLDGTESTALHQLCADRIIGSKADARALVDLLVGGGVDPNAVNEDNDTALHVAAVADFVQIIPALVAAGAAVDARDKKEATPLHYALKVATATALLDAGADVNAQNAKGSTPLYERAPTKLDVATLLIARGARLDLATNAGKLPFDRAKNDEWEELLVPPGRQTKKQIVAEWTAKIDAAPTDAELYIERGNALVRQNERGAAADDYRRAAEIDPLNKHAHLALGVVLGELGDAEQENALAAFSRVIAIDSDDLEARLARATLYDSLGKHDEVLVDCAVLRGLTLDEDQQETVAALEHTAQQEKLLATLTPIEINERWYGVTLPREYREFLERKQYEQYPHHRPGRLPNYRTTPRAIFIVGRDLFAEENGKGRLKPSHARESHEMLQSADDVGKPHSVGDHIKQELFSGLEFDNFEAGELEKLIPFAIFGDSQALAIDISQGDTCPVKMYEHEAGKFYDVSDSIAEFLSAMEPMPADDEDESESDDD